MRSPQSASDGGRCIVHADCIGDRVHAQTHGRVHSVFERACNIETCTGELVTLLAPELGNMPHGIRLACLHEPFHSWLAPGQSAILDRAALCVFDAGVTVDLTSAGIWRGAVATVSVDRWSMDSAGASTMALRKLCATLIERAPAQGFAPLLAAPASARSSIERACVTRLAHTLPMLAGATGRRDVASIALAAAQLLGLGPGLTPSGDDFIAGYLAALWSRAGFESGIAAMLPRLADALAPLFLRTNAISCQMLSDAAQGRFAERLVDVTRAVAGTGVVADATVHALASGHSSGADTLCGLLFGYVPALASAALPLPSQRPSNPLPRTARFECSAGHSAPAG